MFAPHYARPLVRGCGARPAPRPAPRRAADGRAVAELLPGEDFAVLEYAGGWAWGYCRRRPCRRLCRGDRARRSDRADPHRLRDNAPRSPPDGRITSPIIAQPADGRAAARRTSSGACLDHRIWLRRRSAICGRSTTMRTIRCVVAERLIGAPWLDRRPHARTASTRRASSSCALGLVRPARAASARPARAPLGETLPDGAPRRAAATSSSFERRRRADDRRSADDPRQPRRRQGHGRAGRRSRRRASGAACRSERLHSGPETSSLRPHRQGRGR